MEQRPEPCGVRGWSPERAGRRRPAEAASGRRAGPSEAALPPSSPASQLPAHETPPYPTSHPSEATPPPWLAGSMSGPRPGAEPCPCLPGPGIVASSPGTPWGPSCCPGPVSQASRWVSGCRWGLSSPPRTPRLLGPHLRAQAAGPNRLSPVSPASVRAPWDQLLGLVGDGAEASALEKPRSFAPWLCAHGQGWAAQGLRATQSPCPSESHQMLASSCSETAVLPPGGDTPTQVRLLLQVSPISGKEGKRPLWGGIPALGLESGLVGERPAGATRSLGHRLTRRNWTGCDSPNDLLTRHIRMNQSCGVGILSLVSSETAETTCRLSTGQCRPSVWPQLCPQ